MTLTRPRFLPVERRPGGTRFGGIAGPIVWTEIVSTVCRWKSCRSVSVWTAVWSKSCQLLLKPWVDPAFDMARARCQMRVWRQGDGASFCRGRRRDPYCVQRIHSCVPALALPLARALAALAAPVTPVGRAAEVESSRRPSIAVAQSAPAMSLPSACAGLSSARQSFVRNFVLTLT